jgi:hypothetical protein
VTWASATPAASGAPHTVSGPADRRPPNGQGVNGSRPGGFVPREPEHDRFGPALGGATAYGTPEYGAPADATFTDGAVNGSATNGSAVDSPADGFPGSGSYTNGSGSYASGFHGDGSYGTGSYGDGSYGTGSYADGSYANGSHVDPRLDETTVNGTVGSYADEPFGPDWPSLGASGYVPPAGPSEFGSPERGSSGGAAFSDDWSLGYGSAGSAVGGTSGMGHGTGSGFGTGFGDGPDAGLGAGLGVGLGLGLGDTMWASSPGGTGYPGPSSVLPADGSDDWTLPLPVVRPAPEPEPVPDPVVQAPRSRRARRAAAEAVEPEPWVAERRIADDRASDDRTWNDRARNGRSAGGWAEEGWAADVREPGHVAGRRSAEGPRYGGHRAPEAGTERVTRASRRNGSAHTRHADEWDGGEWDGGEWDDVSGPVDRGRHRRPDHG